MSAIEARIAALAPRRISVDGKTLAYREAGKGAPLVLLHGIGSASASWLFQLESLSAQYRVIAWDAPGYGDSDAFALEAPAPPDYARALAVLLGALQATACVLVAQSLGCLIAASYARSFPLEKMLLISPAAGYAGDRARIAERLRQLEALGPEGLAEQRAAGMLSANPPAAALELVRWSYRRIRPEGYRQAAHCLASGNLRADAPFFKGRVLVACGSEDRVTPEAGCREIAAAFANAAYHSLPGLGHASQAEGPEAVNAMIRGFA
ncbi:MAG TPA: alpha/beta fold hydrolase [Burkholderiales bacterium]|nr:alpha/beta fold hydrolase [Burkholderiales bacterium]